MKHYDQKKWILYKKNLLSIEESIKMENHLSECDQCLDIFLSLIDEEEINLSKEIISPEFTDTIMKEICTIKNNPVKKSSKPKSKTLLICYTAAALVTLVLMGNGFFEKLIDTMPHVTQISISQENLKEQNFIMNFSNRIVHKTSKFINHLEISEREDLR